MDTRVPPQGKPVIWLMGHSAPLFERVNTFGLHAIRVHYANGWFARFGKEPPPAVDQFLGKIRLEAATGEDYNDVVNIPKPDGLKEDFSHHAGKLEKRFVRSPGTPRRISPAVAAV